MLLHIWDDFLEKKNATEKKNNNSKVSSYSCKDKVINVEMTGFFIKGPS